MLGKTHVRAVDKRHQRFRARVAAGRLTWYGEYIPSRAAATVDASSHSSSSALTFHYTGHLRQEAAEFHPDEPDAETLATSATSERIVTQHLVDSYLASFPAAILTGADAPADVVSQCRWEVQTLTAKYDALEAKIDGVTATSDFLASQAEVVGNRIDGIHASFVDRVRGVHSKLSGLVDVAISEAHAELDFHVSSLAQSRVASELSVLKASVAEACSSIKVRSTEVLELMGAHLDKQLQSSHDAHCQEIEKALRWRDAQVRAMEQQTAELQTRVATVEATVLDLDCRVQAFQVRDFAPLLALLDAFMQRTQQTSKGPRNFLNDLDKMQELEEQVRTLSSQSGNLYQQVCSLTSGMDHIASTADSRIDSLRSDFNDTITDAQKRIYKIEDAFVDFRGSLSSLSESIRNQGKELAAVGKQVASKVENASDTDRFFSLQGELSALKDRIAEVHAEKASSVPASQLHDLLLQLLPQVLNPVLASAQHTILDLVFPRLVALEARHQTLAAPTSYDEDADDDEVCWTEG